MADDDFSFKKVSSPDDYDHTYAFRHKNKEGFVRAFVGGHDDWDTGTPDKSKLYVEYAGARNASKTKRANSDMSPDLKKDKPNSIGVSGTRKIMDKLKEHHPEATTIEAKRETGARKGSARQGEIVRVKLR